MSLALKCPHDVNSQPNCGLFALAVITGRPIYEVDAWMRRTYQKTANWRGRIMYDQLLEYLVAHDVSFREMSLQRSFTLLNWVRAYFPSEVCIVFTTGHVQLVQGNWVMDQNVRRPVPVDDFRRNRKVVKRVVKIL